MAVPKGPPPKVAKADLDDLVRQWEADKKSRAFFQLAEAYRKQDSLDAAISVLREGLKHHGTFVPAHVALGRCLLAKGQLAQAQAELEPIVKRSPDNILAAKLLAQVLQERGERQRALSVLQRAAPFAPEDEEVGDRIALLKAALGGTSAKGESGETAEFTTSDYTGEGQRPAPAAKPRAPADPPPAAVPPPSFVTFGPVTPPPASAAPAPPPPPAAGPAAAAAPGDTAFADEAEPIDDAEIIEIDADDAGDAPFASLPPIPTPEPADDLLGAPLQAPPEEGADDEFTSLTLAELYEGQGGYREAAVIYERLLARRPSDVTLQRALERCRARESGAPAEPALLAAPAPASPPARPRWEPVRPRETSREEPRLEAPTARGAAFRKPAPAGDRVASLRASRRELRRWLKAVHAARSAR